MPDSPSILVYGRNLDLLNTRGWVLENAGYHVLSAYTPVEAERLATAHPIGLVVLCHTLPLEECQRVLSGKGFQAPARRLLMTANTLVPAEAFDYEMLSAFEGSKALVLKVTMMMSTEKNDGSI